MLADGDGGQLIPAGEWTDEAAAVSPGLHRLGRLAFGNSTKSAAVMVLNDSCFDLMAAPQRTYLDDPSWYLLRVFKLQREVLPGVPAERLMLLSRMGAIPASGPWTLGLCLGSRSIDRPAMRCPSMGP